MNNQTDVSINNVNHQFCNGSPSDQKCKFPPHALVKNEHQSLNFKSENQSERSHSSTLTSQPQADITVTCERPKTWVDDLHFWPLNEKSQLFWCSIMKLPIITEHTEWPLKLLGEPSKLVYMLGDGNCLFRALSYVMTDRQVYHAQVRNKIINHMRSIENVLVPHINTSLKCYLDKTGMAESGVWGTDIEILSASSLLSTDIFVYTKFGNTYKWQKFSRTMLGGKKPDNNCSIYLNHTNTFHYDVVIDVFVNQTNQKFFQSVTGEENNHPKKEIEISKSLPRTHLQTKQTYQTSSSLEKHTKASPSKSKRKQAKKTSQMNFTKQKKHLKKQTSYKQKVQDDQRTTSKQKELRTKNNNLDKSAVKNMVKFHKSVHYTVLQCKICYQAWPQKSRKPLSKYVCLACSRDKQHPKRFSKENNMITSPVPKALQELTQIEEMLRARAFPLMRVYVKPDGQRGYSVHIISLPQDISELAESLPRYPKNVPYLVVSMRGKGSTCKRVIVRREKVEKALIWLSKNNPLYKTIKIDQDALNSLPQNGIPCDISRLETNSEVDQNLHLSESNSDSDSDAESNVVYQKDT